VRKIGGTGGGGGGGGRGGGGRGSARTDVHGSAVTKKERSRRLGSEGRGCAIGRKEVGEGVKRTRRVGGA